MKGLALKVPPVLQLVIALGLMWLTHQIFPYMALSISYTTELAILILVAGAIIAFAGVYAFKKAQTTVNPMTPDAASSLVNSGICQITRNPMYLGFLLTLLAFAVYLQQPLALVWCLVFTWYMTSFQIKPEEHMLHQLFGQAYIDYCQQVRRWL